MKLTPLELLPRLVFFSEEDGEFVATVPGIPLVSALGETEEEALRELQSALISCAEVAEEQGVAFPPLESASLSRASAMLNLSELARRIGTTQSTLASKLKRGTALKQDEAQAINKALRESGVALIG